LAHDILGIFLSAPRGKRFRHYLLENGHRKDAKIDVLIEAIALIKQQLDKAKDRNNE